MESSDRHCSGLFRDRKEAAPSPPLCGIVIFFQRFPTIELLTLRARRGFHAVKKRSCGHLAPRDAAQHTLPNASHSACKIGSLKCGCRRLSALIRSGWSGDAGRGDDCADSARALRQEEDDQGDRTGPRGVRNTVPQGPAIRRDIRGLGRWTAGLDALLKANER